MYILGLHGSGLWCHDPSACLLKDGKVIAVAEEERFVRKKHATGMAPLNAMNFCLEFEGISLEDVDYIAVPWDPPLKMFFDVTSNYIKNKGILKQNAYFRNEIKNIGNYFLNGVRKKLGGLKGFKGKIKYINHHVAHASSAFYCSGFKNSNVLTMDNKGETTSTMLGFADGKTIKSYKEFKWFDSLGLFYGAFTEFLGFKMSDGEGKTMGMASYGKPIHSLSEFIEVNEHGYKLNSEHFYKIKHYSPKFIEVFGKAREPESEINGYTDIAASVQKKLEEIVLNLSRRLFEEFNCKRLCLAGGVALNCIMNGKILEQDFVKDLFVQPLANDAGTSIGACLELYNQLGYKSNFKMTNAYFGPEFSNEEIEKELKKRKLKYEFFDDIAGVSAELLAKGLIGGWFQGRMEIGPRALGNRSIIASPTDVKMRDKVNKKVKHREPWRPFAPSMLDNAKEEYLLNAYPSRFMILSFTVPEEKRKEIPAVVHVDGTTRPHTVEKKENKLYFKLIENFEKETGIPVILNTSFNVRGEPIVCKPAEALNDFLKTDMDFLAIGNFLLQK